MNNNQSIFVTVVAWIFIVGSGFTTLISLMQNIMVHLMFKGDGFSEVPQNVPGPSAFMLENFQFFFLAFFLVSCAVLASSIGLLLRKNWARIIFIIMLSLGVLWSLAGIAFQAVFFSTMPDMAQDSQFADFQIMRNIMMWFTAIISITIVALFIWIIKTLLSTPIRKEFKP
jgi:hypothetical protein